MTNWNRVEWGRVFDADGRAEESLCFERIGSAQRPPEWGTDGATRCPKKIHTRGNRRYSEHVLFHFHGAQ